MQSATRKQVERVDSEAVVEFLSCPEAYEETPRNVHLVETHISWVFLTEQFAYKLKKPVHFDFLDFRTTELRHAACDEEVRLNRRLAPRVYLGVLPITLFEGRLFLNGPGNPVDWVVKMHRLPAERSLEECIRRHDVTSDQVAELADVLTEFHGQLPPLQMQPTEYRLGIEDHVRHNRATLLEEYGRDTLLIRRIHEAQLRLLTLQPELFEDRVRQGRLVEGHGDLRADHVYMLSSPTIIDCVEFNVEFRQLDVMDEIAFLAMECARLGASWIGRDLARQYSRLSGDSSPRQLEEFYKSYRACVRAKVHALRARQLSDDERRANLLVVKEYLRLASDYVQSWSRPFLLVVRGLSGTGKSTLAKSLADSLGMTLLRTDVIRRAMFGPGPWVLRYGEAVYDVQNRERVYDEMFRQAKGFLNQGLSVVLDATFLSAGMRSRAVALATRCDAKPIVIHCQCADEIVEQRIAARRASGAGFSDATIDVFRGQKHEEEPDPLGLPSVRLDTNGESSTILKQVYATLRAGDACPFSE